MPQQSLWLCIAFSAASGLARVVATLVLAYPEFLQRQRQQQQQQQRLQQRHGSNYIEDPLLRLDDNNNDNDDDDEDHVTNDTDTNVSSSLAGYSHYYYYYGKVSAAHVYLACHLLLLLVAAILGALGTVYGPVALSVPMTTATGLLANVTVMGLLLRMRTFDKAQRTGTYVVFFSTLSLVSVGPNQQLQQQQETGDPPQNAALLLTTFPAFVCVTVMTALLLWSGRETICLWKNRQGNHNDSLGWHETIILLTGMTASNVGMATASKTLASLTAWAWVLALAYYLMAAGLGVLFSVVSSKLCEQGVFTPAASVALLTVNMMVGLVIWQDYKYIHGTWVAYFCCACLMCCGVYLLAEVDLLERYRRHVVAQRVGGASPTAAETTSTSSSSRSNTRYHVLPTAPSTSLQHERRTAARRERGGRRGREEEAKNQEEHNNDYDTNDVDAWQAILMGTSGESSAWLPHRDDLLVLPV